MNLDEGDVTLVQLGMVQDRGVSEDVAVLPNRRIPL